MKTVWKFSIKTDDLQVLELPIGTRILHVNMQDNQLCLWVCVDEASLTHLEKRYFRTAGTGHWINQSIIRYIGTVMMYNGALVFHVFEVEGE